MSRPRIMNRFDAQVAMKLVNCPHVRPRRLSVETLSGCTRVEGEVDTYFAKQMAQEILRQTDGVESVDNQLQVSW